VPSLERARRRPAQRGARAHQRGSRRSARRQARRARGLARPRARRVHRVERHRNLAPRRLALEPRAAPRLGRRHQSARWPNRARLRGGAAARPLGRRRAGGAGERQAPGLVTLTTPRGEPPRALLRLGRRRARWALERQKLLALLGVHCRRIGRLAPLAAHTHLQKNLVAEAPLYLLARWCREAPLYLFVATGDAGIGVPVLCGFTAVCYRLCRRGLEGDG